MYRDDVASEAARADKLRRDVAALEAKRAKLHADADAIEHEARLSDATRFGTLARWWGIALVIGALVAGAIVGNQIGVSTEWVTVSCP